MSQAALSASDSGGSRARAGPRLRSYLRWCAAVITLALVAVSFVPNSLAQGSSPTEFQVEAAYLYQFGNFVTWPSSAQAEHPKQFTICVLGRDPFGSALDEMVKGSAIGGLPILAKRIASAKDATSCRVVFLSSSEDRHLEADMDDLHGSSVLTVSSIPDFDSRGGMIQFVLIDRRVRFEINLAAAQKAGLKLSSQLLKVAVVVRGGRGSKE